ncbi:acetyl-CoA carboxylase biotin carboxyl carrier protein [bacterium]|nr:acetyl-CoA carboxylase biotin carboxyl carrier protein [bacterium]
MNIDKLKRLIAILKEESLDEIEIRNLFSSVRVVKRRGPSLIEVVDDTTIMARSDSVRGVKDDVDGGGGDEASTFIPEKEDAEIEALEKLLSPMVGTFYRFPANGKEPFVSVGKRVKKGEVVCIIEAMKLMNEIEAESEGIIKEILAEDSQPVEYGQPLFLIQPL